MAEREEAFSLEEALTHEWLVTDGRGGYASGTVVGPHTRRYHGLLVAPLAPPLGRHLLLAKLEESAVVGGATYAISANQFEDGTVHPRGFEHLTDFELEDGVPVWRYGVGSATLEKRVWMERGVTATHVSYALEGTEALTLRLVPLCSFRDFHHETVGSDDWHFRVTRFAEGLRVEPYAGAVPYELRIGMPAGRDWEFRPDPRWWWQFLHREERSRGQDYLEDCFAPGEIVVELRAGETLVVTACLADDRSAALDPAGDAALARPLAKLPPSGAQRGTASAEPPLARSMPSAGGPGSTRRVAPKVRNGDDQLEGSDEHSVRWDNDAFAEQLRRAAEDFIVARPLPDGSTGATVLAGYHWFGDWGRDTFIALPGLALATGRVDECRRIVTTFARYVDQGMLPNRFPDSGAPLNDGDYNTLDASLWYFHAVDALDRLTGGGLIAEVFPTLVEIVDWHVKGTRFGIRVDPTDGLVRADNPQLTWMDAKVGDWVCTPRDGKPVEIAALWHHALQLMEVWSRLLGRRMSEARKYSALRVKVADTFGKRFWNRQLGYLYDVVDSSHGDDAALRPNQVIAAALPGSPLSAAQRKAVVDTVVSRLWTPRGLRTLGPDDPNYRGRYEGDVWSRDGAYHRGTVWPWLLGPLVDAHLAVYDDKPAARQLIAPLQEHLFGEACAGSISEIFDGDPPHTPRGAIAQAWSVAEVYRAWVNTVH